MRTTTLSWLLVPVPITLLLSSTSLAQTATTFTYQAELREAGQPASGAFDMEFSLWDAASGGTQVGVPLIIDNVPIGDGRLTMDLDFGAAAFDNTDRWLEVTVEGVPLSPRQPLTRVPYAIQTRGMFVTEGERVAIGGTDTPARLTVGFPVGAPGEGRFLVVGRPTGANIEINDDFIQAFSSGSNPAKLFVNPDGGAIVLGGLPARVGVGFIQPDVPLAVGDGTDASLSGGGYLLIGNSPALANLVLDENEIMARDGANPAALALNGDGGNVGIGTTAPVSTLHVRGNRITLSDASGDSIMLRADGGAVDVQSETSDIFIHSSGPDGHNNIIMQPFPGFGEGNVGIGITTPGFNLHVHGSAGKPGGGSWSNTSDRRLKKNIEPLHGALDDLLALRGVTFEYINPQAIHELPGERIGLIAQEVEQVFPDWVDERADGYKAVTFRGFEAMTVEALRQLRNEADRRMQRQQDQIDSLREENELLRARLEQLEDSINQMASSTEEQLR